MKIRTKQKLNGRFYVEITTETKQVFKTMSFKNQDSAKKYADEFLNTFSERNNKPEPRESTDLEALHIHDVVSCFKMQVQNENGAWYEIVFAKKEVDACRKVITKYPGCTIIMQVEKYEEVIF